MADKFLGNIHPHDVTLAAKQLINYTASILLFIKDMWGLVPQGIKPEYKDRWETVQRATGETWEVMSQEVTADWFGNPLDPADRGGDWVWYDYQKGKHITWQQTLILLGIEKANADEAKRHLSIRSGHGVGKSSTCSWIILWFLYCYFESQVPVTAPTSHQLHDVLMKELSIWIGRMPEEIQNVYEWQTGYVRMRYSPNSWFARARTATKENTEAIAGVHAEHVMIICDEASGVPEQVFNTAEGALTSGNTFVILISNPTRIDGYFYDSHHKNSADWQLFGFTCEESPIVDRAYVSRQKTRHGEDSDEYKIRVKGVFPDEGIMDDSGYIQLMPENRILVLPKIGDPVFTGRKILGIDPSGEGKDSADFVVRDRFRAICMVKLTTTNPKEVAQTGLTLIDRFNIKPEDVVIDSFGIGADVAKEIALASNGKFDVYSVLVGNHPIEEEKYNGARFRRNEDELDDSKGDLYLNIRALMFFRARKWIVTGGIIVDNSVDNSPFKNQLLVIKYKRSLQGNKIQLMSKKEMLKLRIPSPNTADAFALTFLRDLNEDQQTEEEKKRIEREEREVDDRFSVL